MGSGFKKGAMVMLTWSNNPTTMHMVGTPRVINQRDYHPSGSPGWNFDPPVSSALGEVWWLEKHMVVIDGKPGDDQTLSLVGKPAPVTRQLTEAEFDAACDRWVMGVES